MALFWVDCKIGVEANNEAEARVKVGNSLLDRVQEDFNFTVSFTVEKDRKYASLEELRREQKKRAE